MKRFNLWIIGEHAYHTSPRIARRLLLYELFELSVLRFQRFDSMFNIGGTHRVGSASSGSACAVVAPGGSAL